jgi:hypothetical protein
MPCHHHERAVSLMPCIHARLRRFSKLMGSANERYIQEYLTCLVYKVGIMSS